MGNVVCLDTYVYLKYLFWPLLRIFLVTDMVKMISIWEAKKIFQRFLLKFKRSNNRNHYTYVISATLMRFFSSHMFSLLRLDLLLLGNICSIYVHVQTYVNSLTMMYDTKWKPQLPKHTLSIWSNKARSPTNNTETLTFSVSLGVKGSNPKCSYLKACGQY